MKGNSINASKPFTKICIHLTVQSLLNNEMKCQIISASK